MDLRPGGCDLRKITADSAGEDVFNPSSLETLHQKKNLMRTAVKVTTTLDVEDPHNRTAEECKRLLDQGQ